MRNNVRKVRMLDIGRIRKKIRNTYVINVQVRYRKIFFDISHKGRIIASIICSVHVFQ